MEGKIVKFKVIPYNFKQDAKMKLLFLSAICFLTLISCSQPVSINESDLSKYSYFIVGFKNGVQWPDGTGFFYRTDSSYRFITAKHILSEKSTFDGKDLDQYDSIGIAYLDTITKSLGYIILKPSAFKDHIQNVPYSVSPDIIMVELMGMNLNFIPNAVNEFTNLRKNENDDSKIDKIIIWGYTFDTTKKVQVDINKVTPTFYEGKLADSQHISPFDLTLNDTLNYYTQPVSKQGMSGAPVFIKYSKIINNKKIEWFEFGGESFGANYPYQSCYIVNKEIALNIILGTPFIYLNFPK